AGLRRGRGRRGGRRSGDLGGGGLGGLLGSLGGLVRLLGGGLPGSLLGTLLAQAVAVLLGQSAHDRRLDGRGRGLHVLAHLLEGGQDDLALNTELAGELVDSDSHTSPSGDPAPEGGSDHRLTYRLIWKYSSSAHERVLRFRVDGAGRPHGWSVALFGCFPNPGGEGVCPDGTFDSKGPGERPPL